MKTTYTYKNMFNFNLLMTATTQYIEELEAKLHICEEALNFYITIGKNDFSKSYAKAALDQIEELNKCPEHGIHYKDCEC